MPYLHFMPIKHLRLSAVGCCTACRLKSQFLLRSLNLKRCVKYLAQRVHMDRIKVMLVQLVVQWFQ